MSTKLFVGGLSWGTNDSSLRSAFEKYGQVTDAKVVVDRNSGRSRGFGFVSYSDEQSARDAVDSMNLKELDGREVRVDFAADRPEGGSSSGGGRSGGGGGYRSGPYDRSDRGGGRRDFGGSSGWRDSGSSRGSYGGGRRDDSRRDDYSSRRDDYSRRDDSRRSSGSDRYGDDHKGSSSSSSKSSYDD